MSECSKGWADRCARAQSKRCRCACGGENHGKASVRLSTGTSDMTDYDVFTKRSGVDYKQLLPGARYRGDILLQRTGWGVADANIPHRFVFHSPTGFEWGYGGSGPSDLALNILCQYVEPPEAFSLHQEFKRNFIVDLPMEGGVIKTKDVIDWIEQQWANEMVDVKA